MRLWAMMRLGFTPDINALVALILVGSTLLACSPSVSSSSRTNHDRRTPMDQETDHASRAKPLFRRDLRRARQPRPLAARDGAARAPARREPDLFGRARTGLYSRLYHVDPEVNPYELEIALIDDLEPDDVPCSPARPATWSRRGANCSRPASRARRRRRGHRRPGPRRQLIREMRFPVFSGGIGPLDSKGRGRS